MCIPTQWRIYGGGSGARPPLWVFYTYVLYIYLLADKFELSEKTTIL